MTDKQIIIDGVDVSGCKHYKNRTCIVDYCLTDMPFDEAKCGLNPNCNYKQLKAKEQECEDLKEEIAKATMEICNQCGEKDDYNIPCKQIRDLDYGLQLEIEENDKLKQTLTEIKEIAEDAKTKVFVDMEEFWKQILQKCEVLDE